MVYTFGGAMAQTFGTGGAGQPIVTLVCIATVGSLSSTIAGALGQGQISNMIKLVTVFSCISLVINVVWKAISALASAAGVGL
jgi:hypothetical protein